MSYLVICAVALIASALTFFSGFGLGTLLLPTFALFFPIEHAVALTAVVHFLNSLFKLVLAGRHADRGVVLRFGVPAIAAALLGAWLLLRLADIPPMFSYPAFGRAMEVTPVKLVVGALLLLFSMVELLPRFREATFAPRYMPVGGALSGFFGGLSGMQGALRSAFLSRAGLTKEAFIGTSVVIACLVDFSRLGVYSASLRKAHDLDYVLLAAAVLAAFTGAVIGNYQLKKMTMPAVQRIVAVMLFVVALGLIAGLI
jgi:uncharacterized membrane protein YfcA